MIDTAAEKAKHWKEAWSSFYKNKNLGKDYVLIRIIPFRLELVSYSQGLLGDPRTWRPIALSIH